MTERLIAKLDRFGAEAGIKEMTTEIYQFAQLLNDEKMKQWDEWRAKREWVGLTDEEMMECDMDEDDFVISRSRAKLNVQAKLKEKNT
jgi:hypothetical protein